MGLSTGTPNGPYFSQEDLYLEGAPYIFIQSYDAPPLNNPDANGYHWGMVSGTHPIILLGCVSNVQLTEGVTMNDVRCDTVGTKDTVQRRDYIEFSMDIVSLLPLSISSEFMNLSDATVQADTETVGIGAINNTKKWMVYMPKVYDESSNDWLMIHLHKAKFVDAWTVNMTLGEPWKVTGVKLRAFADDSKNSKETFGVIKRWDASAL